MAVRKTKQGAALKRWFKEEWKDEKGNVCGSTKNKNTKKCRPSKRVSGNTPKTWSEMSFDEKKKAVSEKKRVGMGERTSSLKRKK
jgi:glucose dehydrogenase